MCEDYYMWGTPDEVIGKIEKFAKAGMKHFMFCNLTFNFDLSKVGSSFDNMKKVAQYFKG